MNFQQAIEYIESLSPTFERPSLVRIQQFLADRGNPQDSFPCFHIGGTNGKGSTAAILDSLLRALGLKVGRFTGPHLLRWNERFAFDGALIDDRTLARLVTRIQPESERFNITYPHLGRLTWFEFLTVMAIYFFQEQGAEVAVVEVGLGGRFDATNIMGNVIASIITNVELDHTHILGATHDAIAYEKAGIIKPRVPVITAATNLSALAMIKHRAVELKCMCTVYEPACDYLGWTEGASCFERNIRTISQWGSEQLSLSGTFQKENAMLAITALAAASERDPIRRKLKQRLRRSNAALVPASMPQSGTYKLLDRLELEIKSEKIVLPGKRKSDLESSLKKGLMAVSWPGRLQSFKALNLVLDGAHNEAGARALRASLDLMFPGRELKFVISCFENKNAQALLSALLKKDDSIIITQAQTRRATHDKDFLADIARSAGARVSTAESVAEALQQALGKDEAAARQALREANNKEETRQTSTQQSRTLDAGTATVTIVTGSFAAVKEAMIYLGFETIEDSEGCRQGTPMTVQSVP